MSSPNLLLLYCSKYLCAVFCLKFILPVHLCYPCFISLSLFFYSEETRFFLSVAASVTVSCIDLPSIFLPIFSLMFLLGFLLLLLLFPPKDLSSRSSLLSLFYFSLLFMGEIFRCLCHGVRVCPIEFLSMSSFLYCSSSLTFRNG